MRIPTTNPNTAPETAVIIQYRFMDWISGSPRFRILSDEMDRNNCNLLRDRMNISQKASSSRWDKWRLALRELFLIGMEMLWWVIIAYLPWCGHFDDFSIFCGNDPDTARHRFTAGRCCNDSFRFVGEQVRSIPRCGFRLWFLLLAHGWIATFELRKTGIDSARNFFDYLRIHCYSM